MKPPPKRILCDPQNLREPCVSSGTTEASRIPGSRDPSARPAGEAGRQNKPDDSAMLVDGSVKNPLVDSCAKYLHYIILCCISQTKYSYRERERYGILWTHMETRKKWFQTHLCLRILNITFGGCLHPTTEKAFLWLLQRNDHTLGSPSPVVRSISL